MSLTAQVDISVEDVVDNFDEQELLETLDLILGTLKSKHDFRNSKIILHVIDTITGEN